MLRLRYADPTIPTASKYRACVLCDQFLTKVDVKFDAGSVSPTVGETVTGATSGDTGVVDGHTLLSGSFAGSDAAGWLHLSSPTGIDFDTGDCFSDNENLNGSTSGDGFAVADGAGIQKCYGRLHADSNLVKHEGKWYCRDHFEWRFRKKDIDKVKIKIDEGDRGRE